MLAVIVTTYPPSEAPPVLAYYATLQRFLERQGFTVEVIDCEPGRKFQYPSEAVLFIGHGRGAELLNQLPADRRAEQCVLLGHPEGVIDPRDLEWQQEHPDGESHSTHHFMFTQAQRQAVQELVVRTSR